MKKIIALLFITAVGYSMGYCGDGGAKPFRRVYVGLSFTPEVSYRYLVNNYVPSTGSSSSNQTAISNSNKYASPEFGASATFKVGINLARWLAVESGVGYSLFQYKENYPAPFQTYPAPTVTAYNQFKETYHYMAVPLGLRFSIGHRKVRGIITGGTDFDFLIKQKEVATANYVSPEVTSVTVNTKNFHTFNLSPYFGVGVDCYATPGFVIRLMPVAQMQALKNINQPVSEYLWNVGFNVSFLFGL